MGRQVGGQHGNSLTITFTSCFLNSLWGSCFEVGFSSHFCPNSVLQIALYCIFCCIVLCCSYVQLQLFSLNRSLTLITSSVAHSFASYGQKSVTALRKVSAVSLSCLVVWDVVVCSETAHTSLAEHQLCVQKLVSLSADCSWCSFASSCSREHVEFEASVRVTNSISCTGSRCAVKQVLPITMLPHKNLW